MVIFDTELSLEATLSELELTKVTIFLYNRFWLRISRRQILTGSVARHTDILVASAHSLYQLIEEVQASHNFEAMFVVGRTQLHSAALGFLV